MHNGMLLAAAAAAAAAAEAAAATPCEMCLCMRVITHGQELCACDIQIRRVGSQTRSNNLNVQP